MAARRAPWPWRLLPARLGDAALDLLHLLPEGGGRHPKGPVAQNDQLLRPVGGGDLHPVMPAQLIGGPLDIGVRRLRLLGVDHMDVVVLLHGPLSSPDLVGVEDGDDPALLIALKVAQQIAEGFRAASRLSRAMAFSSSQAKMMLYPSTSRYSGRLGWGDRPGLRRLRGDRAAGGLGRQEVPALPLAVGPLENGLELLVLLDGPGVGGAPPGLGLFGSSGGSLRRRPPAVWAWAGTSSHFTV